MKDSIIKRHLLNNSLIVSCILLLILGWSVLSISYDNDLIFPTIPQIIKELGVILTSKVALVSILWTIIRVVITVLICFIIGFGILIIYVLNPVSISFFKPLITIMRSTPLAVVSIFIFILIGADTGPYVITLLMTFPVVIEGLIVSINQIDKEIIDETKTLKGSSIEKITQVYIPIIMPYILMTFIQSLGMSFKVIIMGEYICQTKNSIGKLLYNAKANLDMATLIGYGIIIVVIVTILEQLIKIKKK